MLVLLSIFVIMQVILQQQSKARSESVILTEMKGFYRTLWFYQNILGWLPPSEELHCNVKLTKYKAFSFAHLSRFSIIRVEAGGVYEDVDWHI